MFERVLKELGERRATITAGVAVVILLALGGWWLASRPTTVPIGHDEAIAIARDFFASPDTHGAGSIVTNLKITAADFDRDAAGRPAWKISIQGNVTEAGRSAPSYTSHMWLFVDAATGTITVFALG